jgi:hypothetical protein
MSEKRLQRLRVNWVILVVTGGSSLENDLLVIAVSHSGGRGARALLAGAMEAVSAVPSPAWRRRQG